MALTATATKMLQRKVAGTLGMHRPNIFSVSPSKRNIMFAMATPYNSIEVTFHPLLMSLAMERITMPRTIIYCRRYEDCADLYMYFRDKLGENFTEPIKSPDLSKLRLVDMFTGVTDPEVKTQIISSFL